MTTELNTSCPRCGEDYDSRYSAASRATSDSDIEVCGPCGTDEATGRGAVQVAHWPIGPNAQEPIPEDAVLVNAASVADMVRNHPLGAAVALEQLRAALPSWAFDAVEDSLRGEI